MSMAEEQLANAAEAELQTAIDAYEAFNGVHGLDSDSALPPPPSRFVCAGRNFVANALPPVSEAFREKVRERMELKRGRSVEEEILGVGKSKIAELVRKVAKKQSDSVRAFHLKMVDKERELISDVLEKADAVKRLKRTEEAEDKVDLEDSDPKKT